MRMMFGRKDGGPESHVYAYGLEVKSLFSVLVLRFEDGTRPAFHSHAFNSLSWLLHGRLHETLRSFDYNEANEEVGYYTPSLRPIFTMRETYHQVRSMGRSWVLSFRGPWHDSWFEVSKGRERKLTHGRQDYR